VKFEAGDKIVTRRTLLLRLRNWDDQEGWRDFFETYWKVIYGAAIKSGLTHTEAEEVVQETVITVMHRIKEFHYDPAVGSFKGWLLNITRWRIGDQLRKRRRPDAPRPRRRELTTRTATVERLPDPAGLSLDEIWEKEWQNNAIRVALRRVKEQVAPHQYRIFKLYVLRDWPVAKIAAELGVTATQVYLAKHRVAKLLKDEIRRLQSQPLRLPGPG